MKVTLTAARVNAGMSQEEMAKTLGISRATLCKWENGSAPIRNAYLLAICQITGFTKDEIFLPLESTDCENETQDVDKEIDNGADES